MRSNGLILIGNCDAHGKNYSLLYDSPAPSLAPFYDLLSTSVYGELTQRLAMSIGGATTLDEVGIEAWERLAAEVGLAPRFLRQRVQPFIALVLETCEEIRARDADPLIDEISDGMRRRARRSHPGLVSPSSGELTAQ